MTFSFRPAVRDRTSLLIGVMGPSGSGKTYTALSLATGLAGDGGKIAVIDTEAGRAKHYADQFRFDHGDMTPPFSPQRYMEAIKAADEAGYDVIVIDSFSHEYEGEGGIIEWADRLAEEGVKSPGNWKDPKTAHKRMVGKLLQCRAHLIFCMRAEEKMLMQQVPATNPDGSPKMGRNGKPLMYTNVIPAADRPLEERWQPICEKRLPYELTTSLLLLPSNPGVPVPLKLQEQHRPAFPQGKQAGVRSGEILRAWATGGKPNKSEEPASSVDQSEKPKIDPNTWAEKYISSVKACTTMDQVNGLHNGHIDILNKYEENHPEIWQRMRDAENNRIVELDKQEVANAS